VIGAVSTAVIYALAKKLKPALMLDTACTGLVLGQVIGRWGNFFNREAFGGYTDNLLAMRLPLSAVRADEVTELMMEKAEEIGGETFIQVHPTFLYESLWNLGVLFLLLLMTKKKFKKADGEIFLWYLLLYGAGRFWIEGLRTDQLRIWGTDIAVSQLLAAVLALCSGLLIILIRFRFRDKKRID
jgi:phosphatidylglycerol:prolipoprotein diacylglycerol transferase